MHAELRAFAPNRVVEKASYDDFYLDVSPACSGASAADPGLAAAPAGLSFACGASWPNCPPALRAGIQVRAPPQRLHLHWSVFCHVPLFACGAGWADRPPGLRAGIQVSIPLSACTCVVFRVSCMFPLHVVITSLSWLACNASLVSSLQIPPILGSTINVFVGLLALCALSMLQGCGRCCSTPGMTGFRACVLCVQEVSGLCSMPKHTKYRLAWKHAD